ncbi:hypothetical protein [Natronobiforma cellulositropha]|nr:hypothetical protein [Natronobiforma cellulositropha]
MSKRSGITGWLSRLFTGGSETQDCECAYEITDAGTDDSPECE